MPGPDLEQQLASTFAAFGEPQLAADQRADLGPALRRHRARRRRLASGAGVAFVVAGLAAGLPLGLGSAPPAPQALSAAPATCVEVQVGGSVSCRGSVVVSSQREPESLNVPSFSAAAPTSAGASAPPRSAHPVGVTVGSRLVISLPKDRGVHWSPVVAVVQPSNVGVGSSPPPARSPPALSGEVVRVSTAQMRTSALAVVVAVGPGTVSLEAHGQSTCAPGKNGCVVRSVTWSWELRVAPQGATSGT